jgi:hypothetical protein
VDQTQVVVLAVESNDVMAANGDSLGLFFNVGLLGRYCPERGWEA